MAVDDDILNKTPFGLQLAGVVVNDSVTREAISDPQSNLKDDSYQPPATTDFGYDNLIESTKTNVGTGKLQLTDAVVE